MQCRFGFVAGGGKKAETKKAEPETLAQLTT